MTGPVRESRYRVEGMDCASCAAKIDTAVRRVVGVEGVSVSVSAATMTVRHAGNDDVGPAIRRKLRGSATGFRPWPATRHQVCLRAITLAAAMRMARRVVTITDTMCRPHVSKSPRSLASRIVSGAWSVGGKRERAG